MENYVLFRKTRSSKKKEDIVLYTTEPMIPVFYVVTFPVETGNI
jgi:hypothetical protein